MGFLLVKLAGQIDRWLQLAREYRSGIYLRGIDGPERDGSNDSVSFLLIVDTRSEL